jgi:hypothetical protein
LIWKQRRRDFYAQGFFIKSGCFFSFSMDGCTTVTQLSGLAAGVRLNFRLPTTADD